MDIKANPGKQLSIEVAKNRYVRLPIKTHIITKDDQINDVISKYTRPYFKSQDMLFISEKIIAIMQGRAYHIKDIKTSRLAKFLCKFVHKTPYGIGIGRPETMELALREAGALRLVFAALIGAFCKIFSVKGVFYKLVGRNVNAIDGPCSYTIAPYNQYAKLGPSDPDKVAQEIKKSTGLETIIIDANDLGVNILGKSSSSIDDKFCQEVFKDNPLGQSSEQTPLCLVRKLD